MTPREIATAAPRPATLRYFRRNYDLYLLLLPGIAYLLLFKYAPLYGLLIAFKDYDIFAGDNPLHSIFVSTWVGGENFRRVMGSPAFIRVLSNTVIISAYKLVFLFPLPIMLALLLNEVRSIHLKRAFQTVVYLPHFLSWVIVSGLFLNLLSGTGIVNQVLMALGRERPLYFFMESSLFRGLLVFTDGWKSIGWGSIVYLAAITGVDPQLYEAAIVDGANRLRQTISITLPGILPTVVLLLILNIGNLLQAGFEQVLTMYNPLVYDVADIIQTYVYRIGLGQLNFSLGTSVGLFNSVVAFVMIVSANSFSKRAVGRSIW